MVSKTRNWVKLSVRIKVKKKKTKAKIKSNNLRNPFLNTSLQLSFFAALTEWETISQSMNQNVNFSPKYPIVIPEISDLNDNFRIPITSSASKEVLWINRKYHFMNDTIPKNTLSFFSNSRKKLELNSPVVRAMSYGNYEQSRSVCKVLRET